ncbi:MAG: porin [Candidatus Omnitrophota bacterium]
MKKVLTVVGVAVIALSTMSLGASAGALAEATSSALGGIEFGGFLDLSWTYNFQTPDLPFGQGSNNSNVGRVFDVDNEDLVNINLLNFYIDNLPEDSGEVGFRVDFGYGEDANIIAGNDGIGANNLDLYQLFISYIAPVGNGLTIDVGRFASWYGYEAIESLKNDNFSRSFMFGLSYPHTHTGIRATYSINDMWEVSGGVTQGWDTVEDINDSKSFHFAVRFRPTEEIYVQNAISYGPERFNDNSNYRFLYDLVATWNVTEDWTIGANFDYGFDEDAIAAGTDDASWWALAGYVRYDVNEDVYLALRGEYFGDDDSWATPQPGVGASDNLWEITATAGYQITEDLLGRLEYRHDEADGDIFWDDNIRDQDSQDTIALEVIYQF